MAKRVWWLRSVGRGVLAVLLVGALRLALVNGWLRPVRAQSESMWPAIHGKSFRAKCDDCGFEFQWNSRSAARNVVCANCGFSIEVAAAALMSQGERLLVDRLPTTIRHPKRFQIVATQRSGEENWSIKRVVALPGEQLAIRRGDLFANNKMVQKSLTQLRPMAIVVHDDRFRPSSDVPRRWQTSDSGWSPSNGRFEYQSPTEGEAGRLTYHHWLCISGSAPPVRRTAEAGIVDSYASNPTLSREYLSVTDILLTCQVETMRPSVLEFSIASYAKPVRVVFGSDQPTGDGVTALVKLSRRQRSLEVAVCDGQVLVGIDGHQILRTNVSTVVPDHVNGRPLEIKGSGHFALNNLRVARDIYYLGPNGEETWSPGDKLADDEFFLLGDNVPVSLDSRQQGPLPRRFLVGTLSRFPSWLGQ